MKPEWITSLIFLFFLIVQRKCEDDSTPSLEWWLQGSPVFGGGDEEVKFPKDLSSAFPDPGGSFPQGGFQSSALENEGFGGGNGDEGAVGASGSYQGGRHLCFELVAKFSRLNPDGVKREVITVNDRFPGPTIRVRLGDTVTIRVRNLLKDSEGNTHETSVHYHGIEMRGTPWWDGPELVTQCPIPYGGFMDYTFTLIQCGTYWWHAHTNWQYLDGFWGFLIVESNTTEVYQYDDELMISVFDWTWLPSRPITQIFDLPTTSSVQNAGLTPIPTSALVNGRGNADCDLARDMGFRCNQREAGQATVFNVLEGWTYRLRVLNPSGHAAFNFSIEGHFLRVIEMDGVDTVESEPVELVTIWPAQRYSFLVTMNSSLEGDVFLIRNDAHIVAPLTRENVIQLRAIQPLAALHYVREGQRNRDCRYVSDEAAQGLNYLKGSEGGGPQGRPSCKEPPLLLEPVDGRVCQGNFKKPRGNIDKAQSTVPGDCLPPPVNYYDPYYPGGGLIVFDQMMSPPAAMTCPGDTPPDRFDEEVVFLALLGNDTLGFQRWTMDNISYTTDGVHVPAILRVTEKEKVPMMFNPQYINYLRDIQVVLNNLNDGAHPFHLHGHTFWVIATGEPGEGPYDPVRDAWKVQSSTPIRRDTTHVHEQSWLVFRFTADNPGTWLFHCHINWHLEHGLAAVFVEAAEQVVCKYQIPEETRRVCEANRVLVDSGGGRKGNRYGGEGGGPWSPYYGGSCSEGGLSSNAGNIQPGYYPPGSNNYGGVEEAPRSRRRGMNYGAFPVSLENLTGEFADLRGAFSNQNGQRKKSRKRNGTRLPHGAAGNQSRSRIQNLNKPKRRQKIITRQRLQK